MWYYTPGSRKISKGQRFGWIAQWKLRQRRKRMNDLDNLRGVWL